MKVKWVNGTDYANIYALFNECGEVLGTEERKIAGREAGKVYYQTWSKYNKKEIRRMFKIARGAAE